MKSVINFFLALTCILILTECKKKSTTEELIYGRWPLKKMYYKKTDASTPTISIRDTVIYYNKGEYFNFLKNNLFIFHRGNDLYDSARYYLNGNNVTIISNQQSGVPILPDTSEFNLSNLSEFELELQKNKSIAPSVNEETIFYLEK